mmetsp:Transcript_26624/g.38036  ORF Transcript_26624/g.38036 Transcript_26624/m.38036 type:complete len:276 (+) Transcript_26624:485-1312(+)
MSISAMLSSTRLPRTDSLFRVQWSMRASNRLMPPSVVSDAVLQQNLVPCGSHSQPLVLPQRPEHLVEARAAKPVVRHVQILPGHGGIPQPVGQWAGRTRAGPYVGQLQVPHPLVGQRADEQLGGLDPDGRVAAQHQLLQAAVRHLLATAASSSVQASAPPSPPCAACAGRTAGGPVPRRCDGTHADAAHVQQLQALAVLLDLHRHQEGAVGPHLAALQVQKPPRLALGNVAKLQAARLVEAHLLQLQSGQQRVVGESFEERHLGEDVRQPSRPGS